MDNRILIVLIVVALVFFLVKRSGQITTKQAVELLSQDAFVIDVRSSQEFASGSLPGAISVPLDQLPERIGKVVSDKDKPLLLHCLSGTRSSMAKGRLTALGYTNVHNLGSYSRAASILSSANTP